MSSMHVLVPGRAATAVASQRHIDATRAGSSRAGSAPGSAARPASSGTEAAGAALKSGPLRKTEGASVPASTTIQGGSS